MYHLSVHRNGHAHNYNYTQWYNSFVVTDSDYLQDLINRPTESLSIEIKGWIDPNTPEGEDKIVRAAIAMRNHGGGHLLIGFHNDTGEPYTDNLPSNVKRLFHQDTIQRIVAKYSSELFETKVHFRTRDRIEFPIIEIGSGVKTPVATKRPLLNNQGEPLFQENKVFIRSLEANNTPSTTEAT
jgi:predicted HTH transcriptional regulator